MKVSLRLLSVFMVLSFVLTACGAKATQTSGGSDEKAESDLLVLG